jgi:hypothetical protein
MKYRKAGRRERGAEINAKVQRCKGAKSQREEKKWIRERVREGKKGWG